MHHFRFHSFGSVVDMMKRKPVESMCCRPAEKGVTPCLFRMAAFPFVSYSEHMVFRIIVHTSNRRQATGHATVKQQDFVEQSHVQAESHATHSCLGGMTMGSAFGKDRASSFLCRIGPVLFCVG